MEFPKSAALFNEAKKYIPGGVNSPVRAFNGVGGTPIYFSKGDGAYLYDVDGNKYVDFVGSWGPMLFGHAHPKITQAISDTMHRTLGFGAPTELETRLAKKITEFVPGIELVRMTSSGTEATMSAIRLARGYTGRDKIIKFEGCYHGHSDSLLVKSGSGMLTMGKPSSLGVPEEVAKLTLTLEYNNPEMLTEILSDIGEQIACVIVEPIAGNMNLIPGTIEFLQTLRDECTKYGIVLIFDEVMSGFRVAKGGATELFGITPDLITLGKVIGGGLPVGAFGGKAEVMNCIAPLGGVYQAGTLSGNPLAVTSGLTMLEMIEETPNLYEHFNATNKTLTEGLIGIAAQYDIPMKAHYVGSMFGVFFAEHSINTFSDVMNTDGAFFKQFFHGMLNQGVYFAPSSFEGGFISYKHTNVEINAVLNAADTVFNALTHS